MPQNSDPYSALSVLPPGHQGRNVAGLGYYAGTSRGGGSQFLTPEQRAAQLKAQAQAEEAKKGLPMAQPQAKPVTVNKSVMEQYEARQIRFAGLGATEANQRLTAEGQRYLFETYGLAPSDVNPKAREEYIRVGERLGFGRKGEPISSNEARAARVESGRQGTAIVEDFIPSPLQTVRGKTYGQYTGLDKPEGEPNPLAPAIYPYYVPRPEPKKTLVVTLPGLTDEQRNPLLVAPPPKQRSLSDPDFGLGVTGALVGGAETVFRGEDWTSKEVRGFSTMAAQGVGMMIDVPAQVGKDLPGAASYVAKKGPGSVYWEGVGAVGVGAGLMAGGVGADIGKAKKGDYEAQGRLFGFIALPKIFSKAGELNPFKYREAGFATEGGSKTVARAVTFERGEGPVKVLGGVTETGKPFLGVPRPVDMPSLRSRPLPEPVPEARNAMTYLDTGVNRAVLGNEPALKAQGVGAGDVRKVQISGEFLDRLRVPARDNPFVAKELPAETKYLTPEEFKPVKADLMGKRGQIERGYGSLPEQSQRPPEYRRTPGDFEVIFKTQAQATERSLAAVEAINKVTPGKASLAERGYGVEVLTKEGGSKLALDYKYEGEPELDTGGFVTKSNQAYGYNLMRPTTEIEKLPVNTLEEQYIRKTGASTQFYRERGGRVIVEPGVVLPKHPADVYAESLSMIKIRETKGLSSPKELGEFRALTQEYKNLDWKTPGVNEKFAEVDANTEAYFRGQKIDYSRVLVEPEGSRVSVSPVSVSRSRASFPVSRSGSFFGSGGSLLPSPSQGTRSRSGPSGSPSRASFGPSASVFESPSGPASLFPSMLPSPSRFPSGSLIPSPVSPSPSPSLGPSPSFVSSPSPSPSPSKSPIGVGSGRSYVSSASRLGVIPSRPEDFYPKKRRYESKRKDRRFISIRSFNPLLTYGEKTRLELTHHHPISSYVPSTPKTREIYRQNLFGNLGRSGFVKGGRIVIPKMREQRRVPPSKALLASFLPGKWKKRKG